MSELNSPPATRKTPILCYVTDRKSLSPEASHDPFSQLLEKIAVIASAGVDWVQIREKDLSARQLSKLTQESLARAASPVRAWLKPSETRIVVNDRLDIAITQRAGGVHLGERGVPVEDAKRFVGLHSPEGNFLLGVSCHSLKSAQSSAENGAAYIFFGPIFDTPSKLNLGAAQGVARLAEVCRSVSLPVLAIGGITLENATACFQAGAAGMAAIRLFQDSKDPVAVVAALRQMMG